MISDTTTTPQTLRTKAQTFVEHSLTQKVIMAIIIFNAITLGLSTSDRVMAVAGPAIEAIDKIVLVIFVVELLIKFFAYRLRFFNSAWNIFDLAVVIMGLMPNREGLSALRGLRVIRVMRLMSVIPQMRAVIQALLDALPGMGAVIIMISLIFYIFAVMATLMYGASFDEWFGTLGRSLYSLFQIMTLESWSMGIVRPVMKEFPNAWALFVPFIVITAFSVLNLFIGLLVNTMQAAVEAEHGEDIENLRTLVKKETDVVDQHVLDLHEEVRQLRKELAELRSGRDG